MVSQQEVMQEILTMMEISMLLLQTFGGIICHFNDGKGNFKAKQCTKHGGFAITIGDFNNDGNLDFVGAHGHYNGNYKKYSQQNCFIKVKRKWLYFMETVKADSRWYINLTHT